MAKLILLWFTISLLLGIIIGAIIGIIFSIIISYYKAKKLNEDDLLKLDGLYEENYVP